jgi:glutathione S-transferase
LIEKLNFISTEVHKGFGPLFARPSAEVAEGVHKRLLSKLAILDKVVATHKFLLGDNFTVADAYLFVVLGWSKMLGFDYSSLANLVAWRERVGALPAVAETVAAEFA